MKNTMAAPKTFSDLQADVLGTLNAYSRASKRGYRGATTENTINRIAARIGHLWAQYLNAVKIRDRAFNTAMEN